MLRAKAMMAAGSGMLASLEAAVPDADTIESIGRWPLVMILGAVCCFCVFLMYKQSRDAAQCAVQAAKEYRDSIHEISTEHASAVERLQACHMAGCEKISNALIKFTDRVDEKLDQRMSRP